MNQQLQDTLTTYANPSWQSNPAMHQLVDGYAKFHAALAGVGAVFVLVFVALSIFSWLRFKRVAKTGRFRWPFEKKVYFCFATVFTFVSLFLALITTANISNAVKPLPGFTDSISSITTSDYNRQLHAAFSDWVESGDTTAPRLVQQRVHDRQMFHLVRFIISGILLVVFSFLSLRLWKTLLARRATSETGWTLAEAGWLVAGSAMVVLSLYMVLAFMANFQGVVAPIANALQFG
ncbi:hypothetical protein KDA14_05790 [Candidatus Saccharibacteria bacterium]|nr:hypothetical protein [Candidatus Saccharibacteria bacterium]